MVFDASSAAQESGQPELVNFDICFAFRNPPPATFATCYETLSSRKVATIEIVFLADGSKQFRTMDQAVLPAGTTFPDAIMLAMDAERCNGHKEEETR